MTLKHAVQTARANSVDVMGVVGRVLIGVRRDRAARLKANASLGAFAPPIVALEPVDRTDAGGGAEGRSRAAKLRPPAQQKAALVLPQTLSARSVVKA